MQGRRRNVSKKLVVLFRARRAVVSFDGGLAPHRTCDYRTVQATKEQCHISAFRWLIAVAAKGQLETRALL